MNRIAFFVDGFNLYHSLDSKPCYYKYKWLNLNKLAHCFVTSHDKVDKVLYFTTYATWNQVKLVKHQVYVKALQSVGVEVVFGASESGTSWAKRLRLTCLLKIWVIFSLFPSHKSAQSDANPGSQL